MSAFVVSRILPSSRRTVSRLVAVSHTSPPSSAAALSATRPFSSEPEAAAAAPEDIEFSSPRVHKLYDRIIQLPKEEVNILGALVIQVMGLKVFPGEFGGPVPGGAAPAEGGAEEVVEEVKTHFDVKLMGFDAKAKIKVIKEVRAITGLGLKEAKEMVESAPKVLSKDMKQEQADELKEKLEAVGAQVEIV